MGKAPPLDQAAGVTVVDEKLYSSVKFPPLPLFPPKANAELLVPALEPFCLPLPKEGAAAKVDPSYVKEFVLLGEGVNTKPSNALPVPDAP